MIQLSLSKTSYAKLKKATTKIIELLRINNNTTALILAPLSENNQNAFLIAQHFYINILKKEGKANILTFKPRVFEEPMDETVYRTIADKSYNLIIQTGLDGIGHDPHGRTKPYIHNNIIFTNILFYRRALEEINAFWFFVKDINNWLESVDINYVELGNDSLKLEKYLKQTQKVKFYSGKNSVLEFEFSNHEPMADYDFTQHKLGKGVNIPFGEVFITPNNKSANGEIVIDGSFYNELEDKTITVKTPITILFKKGKVITIKGGKEAKLLENMLNTALENTKNAKRNNKKITRTYEDNIFRIGEFAIGLNKKAKFCNDLLIDEKVYGTAHIALGSSYNGDPALIHCDMIVRKPKIILIDKQGKEKLIVENHKFQL